MNAMKNKKSVLRLLKKRKTRRALAETKNWKSFDMTIERPNAFCSGIEPERRWQIISAYGRVLENCSSPIEEESSLPYPKELIRQAIYEELTENPLDELRSHLEIAFVQLESFLPHEEFRVMEEFKLAGKLAQEMANSGDPDAIIVCARILKHTKGETAVRIQEDISEKMRRRLKEIRSIGMPGFGLRRCSPAGA